MQMTKRFTIAIGYDSSGAMMFECIAHPDEQTATAYATEHNESANGRYIYRAVDAEKAKQYCENGHGKPFERTVFPAIARHIEWLEAWERLYDISSIDIAVKLLTHVLYPYRKKEGFKTCGSFNDMIQYLKSQMQ